MVTSTHINISGHNANFLSGLFFLGSSNYSRSRNFFLTAVNETDPVEPHYSIYQSYLGLLEVLSNKQDGLYYCHRSYELSHELEFEILINLACAEFISGNRRRAIQALDNLSPSKLSGQKNKLLKNFFELIGQREMSDSGCLKRNQFFNKSLGKIFRKGGSRNNTKGIEEFIRKMVKTLYKDSLQQLEQIPRLSQS